LSATRKKRKPSPDAASVDEVKAFAQGTVIPSVHTTKPPGVSALTLAKNGELFVSGGCAPLPSYLRGFGGNSSKQLWSLRPLQNGQGRDRV
jgi:hypothetical protein